MRRMRDSEWRIFRSAMIVIAVAIGFVAAVHGLTRRWNSGWAPGGWHAARGHTKSLFVASGDAKATKNSGKIANKQAMAKSKPHAKATAALDRQSEASERSIASDAASNSRKETGFFSGIFSRVATAVSNVKSRITGGVKAASVPATGKAVARQTAARRKGMPSEPAAETYSATDTGGAAAESPAAEAVDETDSGAEPKFAENEFGTTGDGQYCSSSEFRGPGIQEAGVTTEEWKNQMKEFHAAKRELLAWLSAYSSALPPKLAKSMETQVKELRIQRPPTTENPDLGWRGIGVLMRDADGKLILRLGGGFPTLTKRAPERAKFELIRLLAQSWSPCELARLEGIEPIWKKTVECLGITEAQSCDEGSYSEAGWAISTAIAAVVAPPPCTLPVFRAQNYRACLDPLKAGGGRVPASLGGVNP